MAGPDLCFLPATELAARLRRRELAAREVLAAHLEQIERVNPAVNAIVTLVAERAMSEAVAADEALAAGHAPGPLHGLPLAVKDLHLTAGIRTTFGSPLFAHHVPPLDALVVARERAAGAIVVGKTNVPEFGAGSQTFNTLFGPTRNPYDLTKTCGGSSGGAAAALACGLVALADGSDMGGSLRNPASFCNVVGLRPAPGRVPSWPALLGWQTLGVEGPMGRTVADVALFLSAIAGPETRAPVSIADDPGRFARPLGCDLHGTRVAWATLGLPYEPAVREVVDATRATFEALGCQVEDAEPELAGADEIFHTLRAFSMHAQLGAVAADPERRMLLKDTLRWNVDRGAVLTGPQVAAAEVARTQLYQRVHEFMTRYTAMVLPVSQVLPFDITTEWVDDIEGEPMATYIDWMRSCSWITVTGLPAISVPAGFSATGLPVGVQIVGRHQDEWGLLQLAHAFEQANPVGERRPPPHVLAP
jgi:amidase